MGLKLYLHRVKIAPLFVADRTAPEMGQFVELRTRRYPAIGVALSGIVQITALPASPAIVHDSTFFFYKTSTGFLITLIEEKRKPAR